MTMKAVVRDVMSSLPIAVLDLVRRAWHVQGVVAVRDRLVYPAPVPSSPGPYF